MTTTTTNETGAMQTNELYFTRAKNSIPGGVNSPVRAFGSVGGTPRFMVSATGPYITDAEGREYVDLVCSWGPAILGHAHPQVIEAVQAAAARGLSFGASTPAEIELAELVRERVSVTDVVGSSAAPIEKLRLVSTGTEATMTAIRLARGFTGRELLVKFAGHYHGHSDALLAEAGSGLATLSMPGSAGVTAATAAQTLVLPYNDLDAVHAVFAEHGPRIAAVIVEAASANMGVVPPERGFNRALSAIAREHGALICLLQSLVPTLCLTLYHLHPHLSYDEDLANTQQLIWHQSLFLPHLHLILECYFRICDRVLTEHSPCNG